MNLTSRYLKVLSQYHDDDYTVVLNFSILINNLKNGKNPLGLVW